ncbi:MAG: putative membrane fusion protein (MFP) component of efflux pump, membrane anchor protein YbhG [Candidatus Jettenia ecosi]|uniref:Putative membrane fusion protein (MFP) component of efflux pump, membrane anchor protein YbhG n=1 Tax=Candidatus Jettenia ecosi TaxID=2494326 RepID=A0A533QCV2_9BACT|nr:MAG: putative membrane fusion protein (MFP) component of efflux pump, membrane anchor protein YbhG [Candidatus Jettenia ecosi]
MRKGIKIMTFLILIGIITAASTYLYLKNKSHSDSNIIRVSGNIEVTDAEVSFKISGRVDKRLVDEGEFVQKDELVALLDSSDLTSEVEIRRAELQMAQADLAELEAGSRPQEIAEAEAKLAAAKADKIHLESDFHRAEKLFKQQTISAEEYMHSRGDYEVAVARLQEAEERLKLIQEGPRKERLDQARARVKQARAALKLAQIHLGYARLASPLSGVVLSKNIEPGEYVAPGAPIVTIGNLENVWLRAYINETDLGRVKVGYQANIITDTYPDTIYKGYVSFIASQAEFTPKNVQTKEERVKLVYRIKINISNLGMELKPGMPADADIIIPDTIINN